MAEKRKFEVLRKITVKNVMGEALDVDALDLEKKKQVLLMRVYGCVTAIKPGASDLGPYVRFIGEFKGVNLQTGELFVAPACIMPRFLEEQIAGACTPESMPVMFGFDIGVKWDKTTPTKYQYTAVPVIEPKTSNAMLALEEQISKLALPAPVKKAA